MSTASTLRGSKPWRGLGLALALLISPALGQARSLDEAIEELGGQLARQIGEQQVSRLTILQVTNLSGDQTRREAEIADALAATIARRGGFQLVDRLRAEQLAQRLGLAAGAQISGEAAARIGRSVGVDAVVTASIEDHGAGNLALQGQAFSTQRGINIASARVGAITSDTLPPQSAAPQMAPSSPTHPPPAAPARFSSVDPSGQVRFAIRSIARGSGNSVVVELSATNSGPRVEFGVGDDSFALDGSGAHLRRHAIQLSGTNAAAGWSGISRIKTLVPGGATVLFKIVYRAAPATSESIQLIELNLGELGRHAFSQVPLPYSAR